MSYTKETETILFILIMVLFNVLNTNSKKSKKRLQEPEDNSEDFNADVFCKKLTRLIVMEKADEIFVVDTTINGSVLLQCKYCEEKDNGLPKTWTRQKHIFTGNITEVETDMSNNISSASVFISKSHSLVFRSLKYTDIGLYFCRAPYVDSPDRSFNYLIDLSDKSGDEVKGTIADLKKFTAFHLAPVNSKLANQTFVINGLEIKIKVFTDWSDWSECDSCMRKEGIRYRLGRCRVKPICQNAKECEESRRRLKGFVFSEKQNSEKPNDIKGEVADLKTVETDIMEFGIALSCRSILLHQLTPRLYNITSVVPDFLLTEKCRAPCKGKSLKKGPRYRKSIILAKGAHLTLVCPDSTPDSKIQWEHNKLKLRPNEGVDYINGTNEPRQYVDSFNTLYLVEVTDRESGNYTCFVDGVRMQEVKIIVLTRSLFFTKEFTRHLKYLGFVFLICFIGYLAGVTVMCVKTHSERIKVVRKKQTVKATEDRRKLLRNKSSDSESYDS